MLRQIDYGFVDADLVRVLAAAPELGHGFVGADAIRIVAQCWGRKTSTSALGDAPDLGCGGLVPWRRTVLFLPPDARDGARRRRSMGGAGVFFYRQPVMERIVGLGKICGDVSRDIERVGDENQGGLGPIFPPRALWQPMPWGMLRWQGRCDVGALGAFASEAERRDMGCGEKRIRN
jgi:hypothetical protein